ncbi:MAG: ABC transporter ATP-binding protein [Acidobacteriota bacterium]
MMIEFQGITKCYGEVVALDDISLNIGAEIFALLGANGAGKSTLLKLILGIIEPDTGRVLVCGHEVKHQPVHVRKLIGYLPENLLLYERLTGYEFLRFVAGVKGLDRQARAQIDIELESFGLHAKRDLLIRQYSFGMKKRIGLIAALLGEPQILILDEPLNGLDVETIALTRARIKELHSNGKTIIFSSHIMDFVERIATRAAILRRGRVAAEGTTDSLRERANIAEGHFEEVFFHFADTQK